MQSASSRRVSQLSCEAFQIVYQVYAAMGSWESYIVFCSNKRLFVEAIAQNKIEIFVNIPNKNIPEEIIEVLSVDKILLRHKRCAF